ncbi:hypothetical protein F5878DRAFT_645409 [Lentinula raphanica]|uniref:Uncharacterized protein n=1 Tax=Lentinula raphanica TaxID=153919 RepID=A0AA38U842_9AGAR|nr:hypothetical protein EV360DRAFT_72939 [Lentinula raphanica]KAJ3834089.1 hypothetical protein F5878DRAFT_645409 [Lentinula raphanica]
MSKRTRQRTNPKPWTAKACSAQRMANSNQNVGKVTNVSSVPKNVDRSQILLKNAELAAEELSEVIPEIPQSRPPAKKHKVLVTPPQNDGLVPLLRRDKECFLLPESIKGWDKRRGCSETHDALVPPVFAKKLMSLQRISSRCAAEAEYEDETQISSLLNPQEDKDTRWQSAFTTVHGWRAFLWCPRSGHFRASEFGVVLSGYELHDDDEPGRLLGVIRRLFIIAASSLPANGRPH